LVYTDVPSAVSWAGFGYSLGLSISDDSTISDVRPGSPADTAGLAPGMKLVAINGRHFNVARLHEAVAKSKTEKQTIELLVENGDYFRTIRIEYQGGERHPHLVRDESRPDIFAQIIKPHASR
jgi:predicted metalloprotease with PDZ domain